MNILGSCSRGDEDVLDDSACWIRAGAPPGRRILYPLSRPTARQPVASSGDRTLRRTAVTSESPAVRARILARSRTRSRVGSQDAGGEPLDRVLERDQGQPLDLTRFLRIAIGLAAALGQVHRHGLIHKDIKPANVLVDDDGNVWLTGFGIASRLPRERQAPAPPEIIAGTLAYMAPEQTGRMNRSID